MLNTTAEGNGNVGIHDLGGFDNLGPVHQEESASFHEELEKLTLGLQMLGAVVGDWTDDEYRHAIGLMLPADYMNCSYNEHWLDQEALPAREEEFRTHSWDEVL